MQNVCQTFLLLCWACLGEGLNAENSQAESLLRSTVVCWSTGCGFDHVTGSDSGILDLGCLVGLLHWVGIQISGPDYTPLYPYSCCWVLDIYYSLTGPGMRN